MNADAMRAAARALLDRSRRAQRLPERVTDEAVLAQVAQLIAPTRSRHARRKAS
jgi:hypothetical protein